MKLNKKGFTLVELLAVIVVLALLMVVAASSIGSALDNSKQKALVTEAQKLYTNINTEIESIKLMESVDDSGIVTKLGVAKYDGSDGDYTYDLKIKDGKINSLIVCYKDEYSVDITSGTATTVDKDADGKISTNAVCTTSFVGAVSVAS